MLTKKLSQSKLELLLKSNSIKESFIGTADLYCFKEKKCLNLLNRLKREAKIVRTYPDAFGHLMAIRGAIDVMVDPWAHIWDFAPCKIIVKEAAGEFSNFTGNKAGIDVGSAVSGNPGLVKVVRRMIREGNLRKHARNQMR